MSEPNLNQNGNPAFEAKPSESVSLVAIEVTKGDITVEGDINNALQLGNKVGKKPCDPGLQVEVNNVILKDKSQSTFCAPVYINTFQDNREPSEKVTRITTDQCPKSLFTGREELLKEIHESVLACSTNDREGFDFDWEARIIVLVGLGGIGKSEVARKYAQNFTNIAWIASEDLDSLTASFVSIAKELQLYQYDELLKTILINKKPHEITEDETKDIVQAVYKHFSKFVKTGIFIFDNAQQMNYLEREFGIFDFLPKNNVQPYPVVLVTSRNQKWQLPKSNNKIQVPELSDAESVAFLKKALEAQLAEISSTDEPVVHNLLCDLAAKLHGHALALTLAAANISKTTSANLLQDLKKYIEIFNKPDGTWSEDKHSSGEPSKYDLIMKNVWSASIKKVENSQYGEVAMKLLNLIAYLPTDTLNTSNVGGVFQTAQNKNWSVRRILKLNNLVCTDSCLVLRCLSPNVGELIKYGREDIYGGYGVLETYSMLTLYKGRTTSTTSSIRIHRLVQKCTRDRLEQSRDHTYLMLVLEHVVTHEVGISYFGGGILLHSFVHERKSPFKSIKGSILIACHLVIYKSRFSDAFPVLTDIYEYLQGNECHYTPSKYYLTLFHLCLLRCRHLYSGDKIYQTRSFSNVKLDKSLVTGTKILMNRNIFHLGQVGMDHRNLRILLALIGRYEPHSDSQSMYDAKKQMNDLILSTVNYESDFGLRNELYKILWALSLMNTGDTSRQLQVNAVCKKHFKLFNSLNHKSFVAVTGYWMQLMYNVEEIGLEKVGGSAWRAEWIRSFVHDGGLHLLVQLTETFFKQGWVTDSCITHHINFIYALAFEGKELASHIIKYKEVMEMLKQVTTAAILDDSGKLTVCQTGKYYILIPWFALFARNSTQDDTSEWSIHSVDSEMEAWLKTLPSEGKDIDGTIDLIARHRPILETFLRSTESDDATAAREIAQRLLLGMEFKEVESERKLKLDELQFSV